MAIASIPLGGFVQHHFGGAAADGQDARVAPQAFDRRAAHVAHAAVELLAGLQHVVDEFARQRLQQRHVLHHLAPLRHEPGTVIEVLACRARPGFGYRRKLIMFNTMLVPTDGSELAEKAINAAVELAGLRKAAMMDLDDRVGTLERGKDADFVILSGDPFSVYTRVLETWVEGVKRFDIDDPDDREIAEGGFGALQPSVIHEFHGYAEGH